MGMAKIKLSIVCAGLALALTAHTAYASAQKGVQAFQRGKYETALKHLEPAAKAGEADAMYVLGQMYASGRGVKKDEKRAADYFKKAAELGNAGAQQSLGSALMLGEGIEQNMVEALKWFIISARAGNKGSADYTRKVGRFLSREMQLEARAMALEWQKAHAARTNTAAGAN